MAVHRSRPHESAAHHVTGRARYVADMAGPPGTLWGWILTSPHAHARIRSIDREAAQALPGVEAVLLAQDIPGERHIGPIFHDEPVLAEHEVIHVGQPVALVLAHDEATARRAADAIEVDYEPLPAILGMDAAIEADSFIGEPHRIERGDVDAALADAAHRVQGELRCGGQEHFYLESQAALALPQEGGSWRILSSTQHPTEVQRMVARCLGLGANQVSCEVPRLGGGFGGKESQATIFAVLAALGSHATGRPVRIWLHRDGDMCITGKRHPFLGRYVVGFDEQGHILGMQAELFSDGGATSDLSLPVLDRALFHVDNAYHLPAVRLVGRVCRTNSPSNTAFRGFGGPQGMLLIEDAINRRAERMGVDPTELRHRNFYSPGRDTTPYGQAVPAPRLQRIWAELSESSDYAARRAAIDAFNANSRYIKRGLAMQPVKFGISFTKALLNQAGALVVVYSDGSVQLNHGGTEMGQGLYTKMQAVCAENLGVPLSHVRQMVTTTEKVPNTSPTAASAGADLNGEAVRRACDTLLARMRPVAAELLDCAPDQLVFAEGSVVGPGGSLSFAELANSCWVRQVGLSATGFYATPGIAYDHATGSGTPFHYFAYGCAVVEVEVHALTGEHRVLRVDILHDVGDALVPSIDRGQVEGAFIQGMGWLTTEELVVDQEGRLLTPGPSTYKIPAVGDAPHDFRVELLQDAAQQGTIHGSKAVGEPPFMLAIGVISALRQAIAAFSRGEVHLAIPATAEAILRATTRQLTAQDAAERAG